MAQANGTAVLTVRERLDRALVDYLAALTADDISDVNIEAVAQAAGVSRATAYRHFGDRDGLLFHAALQLTRQHAETARLKIADLPTVAAKVEEGFAYTAHAVGVDKMLRLLLTSRRSGAVDDVVRALSKEINGEALKHGQRDGQVRSDVSVDEIIGWITEQQYVAIRLRLDEEAVRSWVRRFLLPVLRPQDSAHPMVPEMKAALTDIEQKLSTLKSMVEGAQSSLS
jgi:AcrR family transcriptional regulator